MHVKKITILQVVYDFSADSELIKGYAYDTFKILQDRQYNIVLLSRKLDNKLSIKGGFYEKFQIFKIFEKYLYKDKVDQRFGVFLDSISPDIVHFYSLQSCSLEILRACEKRNIPIILSIDEADNFIVTKKYFSFSHFVKAKKEAPPNHIYMLGNNEKHSLIMHPDSRITFKGINLKIDNKIKFALSVSPDVVGKISGFVRFRILLGEKVIFHEDIDTKDLSLDLKYEILIDEEYKGDVVFETKAISACHYCNVGWKNIYLEQNTKNIDEEIIDTKLKLSFFKKIIFGSSSLLEKYKQFEYSDSVFWQNNNVSVEDYVEKLETIYQGLCKHIKGTIEVPSHPKLNRFKVSIIIPTYNGEEFLENVLEMIKTQKTDFLYELIIVDSGSTDKTVEIIEKAKVPNCVFYTIEKGTFNHGLTRNFGVSKSSGEFIVLLSQDAIPGDENWLANIVNNYTDEDVVAMYIRQVPRDNCNLIIARRVNTGFSGSETGYITDTCNFEQYDSLSSFEKYKVTNFDDVCSSFRRSFWETNPFKKANFAEDLRFGIDVILTGKKILYNTKAFVVHSHNYSFSDAYKRFYVSFLVLLEFYDFANVTCIKDLFKFIIATIKNDVRFLYSYKTSLWNKFYHFYFLFFFNILTGIAQFIAYRDFQKGKIKM